MSAADPIAYVVEDIVEDDDSLRALLHTLVDSIGLTRRTLVRMFMNYSARRPAPRPAVKMVYA